MDLSASLVVPRPDEGGVGLQPDVDGKDRRAIEIMRENSTLSARKLSLLLKEHGIPRNKDWVWKHRCD